MLHRFNFAVFSKGPPATNRESPEGRRGARALFRLPLSAPLLARTPARCRFLLGAASAKNIALKPAGEKKGEVFTLGLAYPWQPADKDEPTDSRSGRSPTSECEAKNIEARRPQFLHLKMKILLLF